MNRNKKIDIGALSPEEQELEKLKRKKKAKRKKTMRVIDRIFGFCIATGVVIGCACLALEYVIVKGPSPALRDTFVNTMLETRRFTWIPNIFLSEEEVGNIANYRGFTQPRVELGITVFAQQSNAPMK